MTVTTLDHAASAPKLPDHHIPAELLLDYAAGSLAEPWSLVVACHLTLCPHCRAGLAAIEQAAGGMLDDLAPRPMPAGSFEAVAARLGPQDAAAPAPAKSAPAKPEPAVHGKPLPGHLLPGDLLPGPLRDYLATGVDGIDWRWSGAGLQSFALAVPKARGGMVSLLRIAPGTGMPLHTHRGDEMTLVLSGGFTDESGAFTRGDVEIADGSIEHRPVAMAGAPCICLAVTDAPLQFRGPFGWILNQWARLSS